MSIYLIIVLFSGPKEFNLPLLQSRASIFFSILSQINLESFVNFSSPELASLSFLRCCSVQRHYRHDQSNSIPLAWIFLLIINNSRPVLIHIHSTIYWLANLITSPDALHSHLFSASACSPSHLLLAVGSSQPASICTQRSLIDYTSRPSQLNPVNIIWPTFAA